MDGQTSLRKKQIDGDTNSNSEAGAEGSLTVLVLRGGPGAEREVSLASGKNVCQALRQGGHRVMEADILPEDLTALDSGDYDVVFPVLHGTFGEDGQLQEIMEERGIDYVGSDAASSRLAMDKYQAKQAFQRAGLATPGAALIKTNEKSVGKIIERVGLPCVVKPNFQGSSIGVVIAREMDTAKKAATETLKNYGDCLVEEYVKGMELTVGIIGTQALPVLEVRPAKGFYDYQAKYIADDTEYIFDIGMEANRLNKIGQAAFKAFISLGCRDLGRVDLILDAAGQPQFLEVNTIPGFTEHSLVPKAARRAGKTMSQICDQIVRLAYNRSICKI